MVLPLAADKVVFKGKPKKGGADEGTAAESAGGVCVWPIGDAFCEFF